VFAQRLRFSDERQQFMSQCSVFGSDSLSVNVQTENRLLRTKDSQKPLEHIKVNPITNIKTSNGLRCFLVYSDGNDLANYQKCGTANERNSVTTCSDENSPGFLEASFYFQTGISINPMPTLPS
jgi:uncharacterized GH25 family protein